MENCNFDTTYKLVADAVQSGLFPGAAFAVGTSKGLYRSGFLGNRSLEPEVLPLSEDTLFDLASLTKVVATTTLFMLFQEKGMLSTLKPVSEYVKGFSAGDKQSVTLRNLLTHTSGLPAHVRLDLLCGTREEAIAFLKEMPLEYAPGKKVVYSCLGFILLGHMLEITGGDRLDRLCQKYIFEPLGMNNTGFNLNSQNAAATEYEENDGKMLMGCVHDENARLLGGIAGNAGLFSTLEDMVIFTSMLVNNGAHEGRQFLSGTSVAAMTGNYTGHLNEDRGFGWSLKGHRLHDIDVKTTAAGDLLSPAAFGHTGFTGTSLFIDPELDLYGILLTNSVHPSRSKSSIQKFRPLFYNTIAASIGTWKSGRFL